MTTILVVEDNLNILENLKETLEYSGYDVLQARDGDAGLELALEHVPDAIISDIVMPQMSGYDMMRALREQPKTAHIPVIFTTALADRSSVKEGMELGAAHYITKPFYSNELLDILQKVLKGDTGS